MQACLDNVDFCHVRFLITLHFITMFKLTFRCSKYVGQSNLHRRPSLSMSSVAKRLSSSFALVYDSYGDPGQVLKKIETTEQVLNAPLPADQVLVRFLASPINPADINTIQGVYSVKPELPAIPGNEGCAEVVRVGSAVSNLKTGDKVIPSSSGFGTWRTHARGSPNDFVTVNAKLDKYSASQIKVNPCTAYRMLKDFVDLQPGDSIIQNGANSAVGKNVIQLAKLFGIKTINVIRKRDDAQDQRLLEDELKCLGADHVIIEEDLRDSKRMESIWACQVNRPRLALNCVNGKNATDCIRHLAKGGKMITYGGMSRQPLVIPTGSLIFLNHKFQGFWMTEWYNKHHGQPVEQEMLNYIADQMLNGSLKVTTPITFRFDQFQEAIQTSTKANVKGKVTLIN